MHRSKMKDQVLVKTNGKLGTLLDRERRGMLWANLRYADIQQIWTQNSKRTRCKQEVVSSWSTIQMKRGHFSDAPYCSKKRISCTSASKTVKHCFLSYSSLNNTFRSHFTPNHMQYILNIFLDIFMTIRFLNSLYVKLVQHTPSWYVNRFMYILNICVVQ